MRTRGWAASSALGRGPGLSTNVIPLSLRAPGTQSRVRRERHRAHTLAQKCLGEAMATSAVPRRPVRPTAAPGAQGSSGLSPGWREICLHRTLGDTLVVLVDLVQGHLHAVVPSLTGGDPESWTWVAPGPPDPAELKAGDGDCTWAAGTDAGHCPGREEATGQPGSSASSGGNPVCSAHSRAPVCSAPRMSGRNVAARDSGCAGYLLPWDKAPQPSRLKKQ